MVCLAPRFLFLAALVATAAMPTFVLQSDARAVDLAERNHDHHKSEVSSSSFSTSRFAKVKGKTVVRPVIPLPPSAQEKETSTKKAKKHTKVNRKDDKREASLLEDLETGRHSFPDDHHLYPLPALLRRGADPEDHHHHHHHHHDTRQEPEAQTAFSLHNRARSRIYGKRERQIEDVAKEEKLEKDVAKAAAADDTWDPLDPLIQIGSVEIGDGRGGSYSDTHHLGSLLSGILKRLPEPDHRHHHHHDHHDHEEVIVNGDNDKVHIHKRSVLQGGVGVSNGNGNAGVTVSGSGNMNEKRIPHHHDRDYHEHDKAIINGDNGDAHIHHRDIDADVLRTGQAGNQQKRADSIDSAVPGVPGTVDIIAIGGPSRQKLASLVLSSVSDNDTTSGFAPLNDTKATEDADTASSPFVLDASNTTQTQFLLVVVDPLGASSAPSSSLANTLAALKAATSSKADNPTQADIPVTLQVPVFEPAKAAMRQYCATFDPNPPKPAALTMERCISNEDSGNPGKLTQTSLHKSQTFAYNPNTGVVRPMWFGVTGDDLPNPVNSTTSNANLTDSTPSSSTNSTSGAAKQMNFRIPTSNKNEPILPGPVVPIVGNATQTVNGTASSLPLPSTPLGTQNVTSPLNVTLVFTPVTPAVHSVSDASRVVSFAPADANDSNANSSDSTSISMSSDSDSSATSTDSSNAATATESGSSDIPAFKADADAPTTTESSSASDATDGTNTTDGSVASTSDAAAPTVTIDEAAIEKMYQSPQVLSD